MTMAIGGSAGRNLGWNWDWRWRTLVALEVGGQWRRRDGGGVAGGIADYAAENTGRRGRSQYPGVISHTFPQFRETPLRAGGIGTAAASRGRFDSTARKTCAIIRSSSGVFSQNHARWNRLRGLCSLCVGDSPSLASLGSPLREGAGFAGRGRDAAGAGAAPPRRRPRGAAGRAARYASTGAATKARSGRMSSRASVLPRTVESA